MTNKEVLVKYAVCRQPETSETTITAGADLAGFAFFEKSPRHLDLETARLLNRCAQGRIKKVALARRSDELRNASGDYRRARARYLATRWSRVTPARVMDIRSVSICQIIKAVGVKTACGYSSRARLSASCRYSSFR
jgi:phosphoribosylanthranilate isomerase